MKKSYCIYIMFGCLIALSVLAFFLLGSGNADSDGQKVADIVVLPRMAKQDDESVPDDVDDLLDKLDFASVQSLVDALDGRQLAVFGVPDIVERIKAIASGKIENDYGGFISYVLALLGADITEFLPMLIALLAIVLAYNIINSVKSKFMEGTVERVVYFAFGTLALSIIVGYFSSTLSDAVRLVSTLETQINAVAPILITLMTAAGATASASVYTAPMAALASGMTNAVTFLAFPALIMSMVFDIVGSVATEVKLDKTAEFFRSTCKWFLGTAFFLFVTVIGVSGITASVHDGITVRAARFALSKYIPVIGGYLSQGFDFLMAGNVIIKNALGSSAVILIVLSVLPVAIRLGAFTLTLKLAAALSEPFGGDRFGTVMSAVSKSSSVIAAITLAIGFLFVLFLSMIICTGNVGL